MPHDRRATRIPPSFEHGARHSDRDSRPSSARAACSDRDELNRCSRISNYTWMASSVAAEDRHRRWHLRLVKTKPTETRLACRAARHDPRKLRGRDSADAMHVSRAAGQARWFEISARAAVAPVPAATDMAGPMGPLTEHVKMREGLGYSNRRIGPRQEGAAGVQKSPIPGSAGVAQCTWTLVTQLEKDPRADSSPSVAAMKRERVMMLDRTWHGRYLRSLSADVPHKPQALAKQRYCTLFQSQHARHHSRDALTCSLDLE